MAETRENASRALDHFVATYQAKYPKAVNCVLKDRQALLAFYDFPAEHWVHLRTTNPIESTFATIRQRTARAKGLRDPRHDAGDDLQTGDVRHKATGAKSRIQEDGSGHRRRSVHQWNRIRQSHRSMQARRLISTMPYTRFDNSSETEATYH